METSTNNVSRQEQQRRWFVAGQSMTEREIAALPTSEQRFFARQGAAAARES